MATLKRASKGGFVKGDVTGTGIVAVGRIVDFDKTHISFEPADGSAVIKMVRGEVEKATKEEYEAYGRGEPVVEKAPVMPIESVPVDDGEYEEVSLEEAMKEDAEHKQRLLVAANYTYQQACELEDCPVCGAAVFLADGEVRCDSKCGWRIVEMKLKANMDNYVVGLSSTTSGRDTVDINDMAAAALRGRHIDEVYAIVLKALTKMGIASIGKGSKRVQATEEAFVARYGAFNLGQQRMCLGNVLRAALKRRGYLIDKDGNVWAEEQSDDQQSDD